MFTSWKNRKLFFLFTFLSFAFISFFWKFSHAAATTLTLTTKVQVIDQNNFLVLDDGEDGNYLNLAGGSWYTYNDEINGGDSVVNPRPFTMTLNPGQGVFASNYYAQLSGTVTTTYPFGYIGLATTLDANGQEMDITSYSGIHLFFRGDGKTYRLRIKSSNISDTDYYGYTLVTTSQWQDLYLPFTLFAQEGWGIPKARAKSLQKALEIQWQTIGQPLSQVDLQVDNRYLLSLDDCEDGDIINILGGNWYTLQDGTSTVSPTPFRMTKGIGAGAYGSNNYVQITGSVAPGGCIGIGTTLHATGVPVDLTAYAGLRLMVKGDGQSYRLRIKSSNITDGDYYGYNLLTTNQWRNVIVAFNDMTQEGWGLTQDRTESLRNALAMEWKTKSEPLATVTLEIDNFQDSSRRDFLRVAGREIVDDLGNSRTLRGICNPNGVYTLKTAADLKNNSYFHLLPADYAAMRTLGAKVLRFYMQYYWLDGMANQVQFFDYLDRQIRYARQQGIYLILNLHYFGTANEVNNGSEDGFYTGDRYGRGYDVTQFWQQISQRYKDEPYIAAYDLINEPQLRAGFTATDMYNQYQAIIQILRSNGDNHIIIVSEGIGTDIFQDQPRPFLKLADTNLMYSFHYYRPHEFTHQTFYYDENFELSAEYPFVKRIGAYQGGYYNNPYRQDTGNTWQPYVGNWVDLHALTSTAYFSISLGAGRSNGEVWFDDLVLERRDIATGTVESLTIKNANFAKPKTYVGDTAQPSYLPAAWYFNTNWIPNDSEHYQNYKEDYFRLDLTEDHTGDGSGSLLIDASAVTWSGSMVYTVWGQSMGIMPTFYPIDAGYEYRISGWIKIQNNTEWAITMSFDYFDVTIENKDKGMINHDFNGYSSWAQINNVPLFCGEFGTTNPSQRDPLFPGSPQMQIDWINDILEALNSGTYHWTYHDYKNYTSRADIFSLFDPLKPDTALQNALQAGF